MNRPRADFDWTIEDGVLFIEDLDLGDTSVTNDAEAVIAFLQHVVLGGIGSVPTLYRDSRGCWDRMIVRDGAFAGVEPLGWPGFPEVKDREQAKAILSVRLRGIDPAQVAFPWMVKSTVAWSSKFLNEHGFTADAEGRLTDRDGKPVVFEEDPAG